MKVKYLGTAAYEGVPSLFCRCETCRKAKLLGGRNLRSRFQLLINDDLLIDFPPDTVWHYQRFGFDWDKIKDCLITHSHSDHLYPEDVEMAAKAYSGSHSPLRFYAARDGYEKLYAAVREGNAEDSVFLTEIRAGERFSAGKEGKYSVLPLWADHDQSSSPVIYSIACGDKKMLYAHDTGIFPEKTRVKLKEEGRFDFISLDCTGCLGEKSDYRHGHMSLKADLEVLVEMKKEKLVDENTVVVLNHFSHNGGQVYDEMIPAAKEYGVFVSYDGMEIEF